MNPNESLRTRRDVLAKKAERLRSQLGAVETEIEEIETAIRVLAKYIVEEVGKIIQAEYGAADPPNEAEAEPARPVERAEFALSPDAPLTRKDMVRAATPRGRKNAVGPKELTDLVNAKFGKNYSPNHIRPLIWTLAQHGEAKSEGGSYWIEEIEPPNAGAEGGS